MMYKGMCNALYSLLTYEKTDPNLTNSRKSMLKKDCDTYDSNPKFFVAILKPSSVLLVILVNKKRRIFYQNMRLMNNVRVFHLI